MTCATNEILTLIREAAVMMKQRMRLSIGMLAW